MSYLVLTLGGIVAGCISGMFGIGGGVLVVPLLIYVLPALGFPAEIVIPTAIGTSLATIAVTTSSGAWAHHTMNNISWSWVRRLGPIVVCGSMLGAWWGVSIDPVYLKQIFAVILFILAWRMILSRTAERGQARIRQPILLLQGVCIGIVSVLVGIGGGTLVVPLLHHYGVQLSRAVAIAAVISVLLSIFSTLVYILLGSEVHTYQLPGLWGYFYFPAWLAIGVSSVLFAPLGAKLAVRLPVRYLRRLFAGLLAVISIHILITG